MIPLLVNPRFASPRAWRASSRERDDFAARGYRAGWRIRVSTYPVGDRPEAILDPGSHDAGGVHTSSFPTTHWSLIRTARGSSSDAAREALAELCRCYWPPIYAFIRARGHDAEDARDLTQGYFQRVLEKDYLQSVDPRAGRFRSFILASVKHYVANEHRRRKAAKRGGGQPPIPLDAEDGESAYRQYAVDDETPERVFERGWANVVMQRAKQRLRERYASRGRAAIFDSLEVFVTDPPARGEYEELAETLGMSESALKVTVHRLRKRFAESLRTEVALLSAHDDDIDDEVRELLDAL